MQQHLQQLALVHASRARVALHLAVVLERVACAMTHDEVAAVSYVYDGRRDDLTHVVAELRQQRLHVVVQGARFLADDLMLCALRIEWFAQQR